jgi:hypothetical protein
MSVSGSKVVRVASLSLRPEYCIRQHTSAYVSRRSSAWSRSHCAPSTAATAYVSIRQHTSAYVSRRSSAWPRSHCAPSTSAYARPPLLALIAPPALHTLSAYVSIRQHTSAYVSIRQPRLALIAPPALHHVKALLRLC